MSIKLNAQSGGSVALDAPTQTTSSADLTFKLPVADGSANQLLKTDGSKNLGWATGGKILQVTQGLSTTENNFTTTSFVATTLSATITPTAASSKILIQSSFLIDTIADGRQIYAALFRSINGGTFTNISGGSNTAAVATYGGGARVIEKGSVIRLDTPSYSVGNSIVYKLYGRAETSSQQVRITGQGVEDVIVLQEVAA